MSTFPTGKLLTTHTAAYRIVRPLGAGGRGQTYHAKVHDIYNTDSGLPPTGTDVVIKVVKLDEGRGMLSLRRFMELVDAKLMEEAFALRKLADLPCVARYVDTGTVPVELRRDLVHPRFLVQEYIDGVVLEDAFDKPFLGVSTAADWFELACTMTEVLLEVHQRGIVHNDIWPRNIMLREGRKPVLIDFGEAVFRSARELSLIDQPKRRDVWIAPEWSRTHMRPSRRADIFSLGGVLFWLACGEDPPMPDPDNERAKIQIDEAIRNRNGPLLGQNVAIAEIIARCRRYDRAVRIRDAERLRRELLTYSRQVPRATPVDTSERVLSHARAIAADGSVFLSRMADMLLRDAARQIEDMRTGVIDIGGHHDDLVTGCVDALASLQEGDEYLALSTLKFWRPVNIGIRGRFLAMTHLCAQRGVNIKRVFLLTPSDTRDEFFGPIMDAQMEMQHAVGVRHLETRFRFLHEAEFKERVELGDHCGYWISSGQVMEIVPVYDINDQLRSIRLIRSDVSPIRIRERFQNDFDHAEPLTIDRLSKYMNAIPEQ
jgi:serine/threonine protein kinase